MRCFLILMALFLIACTLTAQGDANVQSDGKKTKLKHQYPSVKINIAGLSNTLNTGFGIAYDLPLSKHWFVEAELGPILYSEYVKYNEESHYGFRTRASIKYILNTDEEDNSYTYFKGMFKYNRAKSRRFLTTFSADGNYSKLQLLEGPLETYGPSLHLGFLQIIDDANRFYIDFSGGLGLIFWDYFLEIPPEFELFTDRNSFLFEPNTSGAFLDMVLTFKIGMYLGKG